MTTPAGLFGRLDGPVCRAEFAAFAAACATRLAPVFESFARTGKGRYAGWLAQLGACIGSPDPARNRELQQQIKAAPEAFVDDSNRPDYYAMRVLGVLFYAVQVLAAGDMEAAVLRCSRAAVSLLRDLDYALDTPPGSAGALAELELRAEREWVDQRNASPRSLVGSQAIEDARTSNLYMRLQEVPGDIALAHDWDLTEW
jgi:hypothetical protein